MSTYGIFGDRTLRSPHLGNTETSRQVGVFFHVELASCFHHCVLDLLLPVKSVSILCKVENVQTVIVVDRGNFPVVYSQRFSMSPDCES